jgi:hypothetical protein
LAQRPRACVRGRPGGFGAKRHTRTSGNLFHQVAGRR